MILKTIFKISDGFVIDCELNQFSTLNSNFYAQEKNFTIDLRYSSIKFLLQIKI